MELVSSPTHVIILMMPEFIVRVHLLKTVQTVMSVWWMIEWTMKVEWKCATTRDGVLSAMTTGVIGIL